MVQSNILARRRQRGLSIIELMTVVAVVAIAATVGVPSFQSFVSTNQRSAQTNDFVAALSRARVESMKRSRVVSVCKSSDGTSCTTGTAGWQVGWIVFVNSNGSALGTIDTGDIVLEAHPAFGGSNSLTSAGTLASLVAFRPTGVPTASGTFTWCDGHGKAEARGVVLSPSGAAAVRKTNGGGGALSCT